MRRLLWILIVGLLAAGCATAEQTAYEEGAEGEEEAAAAVANEKRGQAQAEIAGATISIDYGRPALEGRDMLSRLPDGEVWRLGMDSATGLVTSANLVFGESELAAGSYTLFARKVSAQEWKLLVNSQTGIWGNRHNSEYDVAEIPLETSEAGESVERFTVQVNSTGENTGELVFEWDTLRLRAPFQAKQ